MNQKLSDHDKVLDSIRIERFDGNESDLSRLGFKKIDPIDPSVLGDLIRTIPQVYADHVTDKEYLEANKGSYRIIMDKGAHLGKSRKTEGAFSPNSFDADNHFLRPVELIENKPELRNQSIARIMANAYNILSIAFGQYINTQIASNLAMLDRDIVGIKQYLEDESYSELVSYVFSLQSISRRIPFLQKEGTIIKANYMQDVEAIRRFAVKTMTLAKLRITSILNKCSKNDSFSTVTNNINGAFNNLLMYNRALQMFGEATAIYVSLGQLDDPDTVRGLSKEIIEQQSLFEEVYTSCSKWSTRYFREVKEGRSPIKKAISFVVEDEPLIYDYLLLIGEWEQKAHDLPNLYISLKSLDNHIQALMNDQFIATEDSVYVKMPR